jgi:hypothetical protein
MQSLVLMLSWSVGDTHASSLLGAAISELTLDHAALWLLKCWTLVELQDDSLKW